MAESDFLLDQTNDLARRFAIGLGYTLHGDVDFYREIGKYKTCWDLAAMAQMELTGRDANDAIPKGVITASDILNRIRTAKDNKGMSHEY